jgi:hypothetical protein
MTHCRGRADLPYPLLFLRAGITLKASSTIGSRTEDGRLDQPFFGAPHLPAELLCLTAHSEGRHGQAYRESGMAYAERAGDGGHIKWWKRHVKPCRYCPGG